MKRFFKTISFLLVVTILLLQMSFIGLCSTEKLSPFQKFIIEALSLDKAPRMELYSFLKQNFAENTIINEEHSSFIKNILKMMDDNEVLDAIKLFANRSQTAKLGILLLIAEGMHEINGDLDSCKGIVQDFNNIITTNPEDNRGIAFIFTILSQIKLYSGQSVAFNGTDEEKIKFKMDGYTLEKRMVSNAIDLMKTFSDLTSTAEGATSFDRMMDYSEKLVNKYPSQEIKTFKVLLELNGDVFADNIEIFSDINDVEWANEAIHSMATTGVLAGMGNGEFRPNDLVTREQFVKMIVKAFKMDDSDLQSSFSDVNQEAWYYKPVAICSKKGIVGGYPDGSFGIGKNITRQDAAVILYRTAKLVGSDLRLSNKSEFFTDDEGIANYAKDAVYSMQEAGIIKGLGENMFKPSDGTTRAQAAKLVYMLSKIKKKRV